MDLNLGLVTQGVANNPYKTNKFYSTQAITKKFFGTLGATPFYSHFNPFRRIWEYLIIFLSLVVPMEMLFVSVVAPNMPIYAYSVTFIFDIFFAVDIYIIRRTAILHNGEILTKPKKITKIYGKWSIVIQIISCIPLSWIGLVTHNVIVYLVLSINRLLRLHRGWRAFVNTHTLLPYIGGPMSILPVIFFLIFAVDIFSTIFLGIARIQDYENSWLASYHERGFSQVQCFFVSVYFVMTTILTIGFGDISPMTAIEVVITIFIQLVGVSMHAGMTSLMVALIIDPAAADFVQHYKVMQDFLKFKKVDRKNRNLVHNYYQYQYERTGTTGNMKHILNTLPVSLRSTIKLEMTKTFFQLTHSFTNLSNKQLVRIVDAMNFKTFSPNDVILVQGEKTDRIYFFKSGLISVIIDGRKIMTQSCNEGIVNGEYEMIFGLENPTGLKAITYVEAWYLKIEDIIKMMQNKEDIRYLILSRLYVEYPDRFQSLLSFLIHDENIRKSSEQMILKNYKHESDDEETEGS
ncbi:cation channel family protein [Tritrichomonas foetus]|uniref:Cation channel family protein n=1 Tax=Tritrichomonas foetus TaxID=1144522 RepID=A0A1J4K922_9EUKA|nr:cation channel family protein [Tritrichomonas foetus]|eukprot:OHT07384.1 cation channel family protein [Tritrichomonas foetus]